MSSPTTRVAAIITNPYSRPRTPGTTMQGGGIQAWVQGRTSTSTPRSDVETRSVVTPMTTAPSVAPMTTTAAAATNTSSAAPSPPAHNATDPDVNEPRSSGSEHDGNIVAIQSSGEQPFSSLAPSTKVAHSSAMALFDKVMSDADYSAYPKFKDLQDEDVVEDNLSFILVEFARRLSRNPPTKVKSNELLNVNTVCQYYSSVQSQFQSRWPKNSYWLDQQTQSRIASDLKTNLARNSITNGNGNGRYAISQPVYRKNSEIVGQSHAATIDVSKVCKWLLKQQAKERGYMEDRCHLLLTYLACARGGEVKFLRYDNWMWDPYLLLLEMRWSEAKTTQEHFMTFVSDADGYECDIFHALGCFYALDDGLFRPLQMAPLLKGYVFPSLHAITDKSVASNITHLLQKFVPKEQVKVKNRVSSRSLRRGATTVLNVHKDVTFADALARGGWSSGTNMDVYRVINTAATLAGAKALSGWTNARAQVFPPQLSSLGEHNRTKVEKFMAHLFPRSNMPMFSKGACLWPLLETCTATMIMYHRDFVRDFGLSHPLVETMNLAAEETFGDGPTGFNSLNDWSASLKNVFLEQNQTRTASDDNAVEVLNRCLTEMGKMQNTMLKLASKVSDMERSVSIGSNEIYSLKRQRIGTVDESMLLGSRCSPKRGRVTSLAASSTKADRGVSNQQLVQLDDDNGELDDSELDDSELDDDEDEVEVVQVLTKPTLRPQQRQGFEVGAAAPPSQRSAFDVLKKAKTATKKKKGEKSDQSSILVGNIIIELYKNNLFQGGSQWKSIKLATVTESALFKRTMNLAELLTTKQEKESLRRKGLSDIRLGEISSLIEDRLQWDRGSGNWN